MGVTQIIHLSSLVTSGIYSKQELSTTWCFYNIFIVIAFIYTLAPLVAKSAFSQKQEITATDYCLFLNSFAATGTDQLYDGKMSSDPLTGSII